MKIWVVTYRSTNGVGLIMQRFTRENEARICLEFALNSDKDDIHFYEEEC